MSRTPPKALLVLAGLLAALIALSAVGGIVLGVIGRQWFLIAFDTVVLVTCGFASLLALGRFRDAPALAALIGAGATFTGAVLVEPSVATRVIQGGGGATGTVIAGIPLIPLALARVGASFALGALGVLIALSRRPKQSIAYLVRAAILALPLAALAAAALVPAARQWANNLPGAVTVLAVIFGFFIFGALFAASVHCLIRAFEVNLPENDPPPAPAPPRTPGTPGIPAASR